MSKKKILIIILFILVVIGLAYLLYFVFFRPKPPISPPVKPEIEIPAKLPVTKEAWQRMTYEERKKAGLPLYQWPEKEEVIKKPKKPSVIMPKIDKIAQGRKTFINPISDDVVSGATISTDGLSSLYSLTRSFIMSKILNGRQQKIKR